MNRDTRVGIFTVALTNVWTKEGRGKEKLARNSIYQNSWHHHLKLGYNKFMVVFFLKTCFRLFEGWKKNLISPKYL